MMWPDDLFAYVLEQLAEEIDTGNLPAAEPLAADTFVARSAMQKAIRRGMTDLALSAAANLIVTDRRALWRRLVVIALEDLGVGEVDLLARIVCAARDRTWRQTVGGEWRVAAHLITACCAATRCQSANDLWNVAKNDPALDGFKTELCEADLGDLLHIMCDDAQPAERRGIAVLIALGEDAGPTAPSHIKADPGAIFAAFASAGRHSHVAAIYAEAFRQSHLALAPLSLCLWPASSADHLAETRDDILPPVAWLGDIPAFSLDQYTRAGVTAIRRFVYSSPAWAVFAERWQIVRADWTRAAGELLFRAEGARVTHRRTWELGRRLYDRSAPLGCFMSPNAAPEGMALIANQLSHIDRLRSHGFTAR